MTWYQRIEFVKMTPQKNFFFLKIPFLVIVAFSLVTIYGCVYTAHLCKKMKLCFW